MGKSNNNKSSGGKGAAAAVKKCICTDPYKCDCGNRPERPSRGHKWYTDEQIWGGKGHKQKGASGQVSSVYQEAVVTERGKTKIEMWQRLPSQLLKEYCTKEKRPTIRYTNIETKTGMYKFRVVVPDPKKDSTKDLLFTPALAVSNEEQAYEEACMLALIHLQPKIPHERKLPEPYKTTWLHAIEALSSSTKPPAKGAPKNPPKSNGDTTKQQQENSQIANGDSKNSNTESTSNPVPSLTAAKASTSLQMATTYTSLASKRQQTEEMRKQRNARVRRHEAIRMANQNHPVFMSAHIRKQIEQLLRDETIDIDDDEDEDNDNPADDNVDDNDDVKSYVQERLHHEGFTMKQSKNAYQAYRKRNTKFNPLSIDEVEWDKIYEDCLQWLLVNLNEDQLPEGFDPRGRTLDVIVPVNNKQQQNASQNGTSDLSTDASESVLQFSRKYGIAVSEATTIAAKSKELEKDMVETLWHYLQQASGVTATITMPEETIDENEMNSLLDEEIETLEAIYGPEFTMSKSGKVTVFRITLEEGAFTLEVILERGRYPCVPPIRTMVYGTGWESKQQRISVPLHVELIKFMSTLPCGEPMIFSIHSHIQDLFHSDEIPKNVNLFPIETNGSSKPNHSNAPAKASTSNSSKAGATAESKPANNRPSRSLRPRERKKSFWTVLAKDAPPAEAFPSIGSSLDKTRKSLPASQARSDFLNAMERAIQQSRVLLVTGETGSGKSTQLPAFLLENDPKGAKIVVAQPRRIAATGVASRVAEERGESRPGVGSVGYVVRGDSAVCDKTRLLFCTTGVLLRQLQNEDALKCITHVVIDEVHERGLDSDILLGLLKQYLPANPHLRVVLMSATLDVARFTNYFDGGTPHIHIPGRTFPVVSYTLEDALSTTGYIPPKNRKKGKSYGNRFNDYRSFNEDEKTGDGDDETDTITKQPERSIPISDLLKRMDETNIDNDLIGCLVKYLIRNKEPSDDGSILVFLPGVPEINDAIETIKRVTQGMSVLLLPLHGGLQPKEQSRVFMRPGHGITKVILSTNVAETSVTIPDCTIVIDTAREKQSSYDPVNRMPLLIDQFASKASLEQRRGRAGRVRPGTCYKLISQNTLSKLKDHSEPEIRRVALDQTLLQLMFLGVENGTGDFMKTLLDPPSKESLDSACFSLLKLGAIESGRNDGESRLSPLGSHLAGIPAPPIVAKMLVMGSILGCRDAALAMSAGMSVGRSPLLRIDGIRKGFSKPKNVDIQASIEETKQQRILDERAAMFKAVGNSDHALLAFLFQKWNSMKGGDPRRRFCDSLGLSFTVMKDMSQLFDQLESSLIAAGFPSSPESNANASSWRIIHTCAVAAMAPNQLVRVQRPAAKYAETAEGAVAKDGEARELKFFIRIDSQSESKEERVFIHPSSINFQKGQYPCPYLVFNSMVTTTKPYLRDVTECSTYALLLFGGPIHVEASKGVITVDKWASMSANARIGSLMGGLRKKVDTLLETKIVRPSLELSSTPEMKLIVKLIKTDGLGT